MVNHLLSRESKGPTGLILAVVALMVVFSFLNPRFASVENLQNVLFQSSVPLIIVVGATLVILMGSIDLSVQGVMGAAGMAWILITPNTRTGLDYGVWAWVIALGTGVALGLFAGLIYERLKVPSFVATLGTWYVGLGIGIMLYGNGLLPSLTNEALARWPTRLTLGIPNSFWLAGAVVVVGLVIMNYTRFGRGLLAIGNNEAIARSSGISVSRYKIMALAIAGG
ncbi:ABC transporter permease [Gemmobacter lanyuensis]